MSMSAGKPWAVSTSWKDFCTSLQCHSSFYIYTHCPQPTNGTPLVTRVVNAAGRSNLENWEGKGHAVARSLLPPVSNIRHINVDETAGICITTRIWGGITVPHLISGTVLWLLPMVRDFLFLHPPLGVPLGAQPVSYSR